MRTLLLLSLLVAIAGCSTTPNAAFCCVTETSCAAADSELRPCAVGQACRAYSCIAAECATSADCPSSDAPTCSLGLCISGCAIDDDCAGVAGAPRCDTEAARCVGCISDADCPASAAQCDPEGQQCRGCIVDDECASGVCIEAEGTCAAADRILYVRQGGVDAGSCPMSAPCSTVGYAARAEFDLGGMRVIRLLGGQVSAGSSTVSLTEGVVIDGNNTRVSTSAIPVFYVGLAASVLIEGVTLDRDFDSDEVVSADAAAVVRLFQVVVHRGALKVANAEMRIDNSDLEEVRMTCSGGRLQITRSTLDRVPMQTSTCAFTLRRSRIAGESSISAFGSGGLLTIENNLVTNARSYTFLNGVSYAAGSSFRFNTVTSTSAVPEPGDVISCFGAPGALTVTSNIFASNTTTPIASIDSCPPRHSLFDLAGAGDAASGAGNLALDASTFFVARGLGDYRLAPTSPARGIAEPGLVSEDLAGDARPQPAGSLPDVGAFETAE